MPDQYRPKFTTSASAAEEAREAFEEELEEQGRTRVTSHSFGKASSVSKGLSSAPPKSPKGPKNFSDPIKMHRTPTAADPVITKLNNYKR